MTKAFYMSTPHTILYDKRKERIERILVVKFSTDYGLVWY